MSKDEQHDHEMMVEAIHDKRHRDPLPDNPAPWPQVASQEGTLPPRTQWRGILRTGLPHRQGKQGQRSVLA